MTDLGTRLHDIERVSPPELWADIAVRQPGPPPRAPRRSLALVVAVLVAAAGLYLPIRLLSSDGSTPVDVPPGHRTITVEMSSAAMEPTIHLGETVIVDVDAYRGGSAPSRTEVIAFRHGDFPGRTFLQRVIGLPGERIRERDGVVYIDDVALGEPYLPDGEEDATTGVWQVPTGNVFVMGDNRPNSNDSRGRLGPIPIGQIIGKVIRPGEGTSPWAPRQHPGTNLAGLFVPATSREGDNGIMHVTFPDGSSAEIVYPASLDLAALGVTPSVSIASEEGDIGFPLEFLPRAQPGTPVVAPVHTASGVPVFPGRTRSTGFPWHQHFTYVLEHWNVNVEFPVGITADQALASLDLHEAADGFPVLDLRAPLMFGDGSFGQPHLIVGDAYPGDKRIDLFLAPFGCSSNSTTGTGLEAFLCFEGDGTNLHVEVLGGPGFVEAVSDGLGAREIRRAP